MTFEEKKRIYAALSAQFTDEAIERTEGRVTGKGYDTSGIKYQYVANRLNEVLGIGGWRTQQVISVREVTTSKGRAAFDATCDVTLQFGTWTEGTFQPWAESFATGGHQSMNEADARKGAFTNGLKKAAAMLGCGKQAYEGTLDDDNVPDPVTTEPRPAPPMVRQAPPQQPRTRPETPSGAMHDGRSTSEQGQSTGPAPKATAEAQRRTYDASPVSSTPSPSSSQSGGRNRLTSKQLAALWALARKLNYQQSQFRQWVKQTHGVQPEFLDKNTASTLIGQLSTRAANGHSHPAGEHGSEA